MVQLTERWVPRLLSQPETGMGYQICTVLLKDGQRLDRVTIVGGVITKVEGMNSIPLAEADIADILVTHGK